MCDVTASVSEKVRLGPVKLDWIDACGEAADGLAPLLTGVDTPEELDR